MLIDSNILIYALNQASPQQKAAQKFLQSQKQLLLAQQNIFETLRILTHKKFPDPFPPDKAIAALNAIAKYATILHPTFETHEISLELIRKYCISGAEVFDAYLVATALSNGVRKIATDNVRHLGKYEEIEVVNPLEC